MEDDDDFGDLYSDVLRPLASQLSSSSNPESPMDPDLKRPSRNDDVLHHSPAAVNQPSKTLALSLSPTRKEQSREPLPQSRVSGPNLVDGSMAAADGNAKDSTLMRFDIEDEGEKPVIPGLSDNKDSSGAGGDWDSDSESEDDLQIVLNDSNNNGNILGNMGGSYICAEVQDDDDEDGDPLVIVADDGDANQVLGEQVWGAEVADVGNDEKKEVEGKANGGGAGAAAGAPTGGKVGFSGIGYHPFHSQFKYVRPGASPIPGSNATAPVGAPGQARPPLNMGSVPGRGRGDWRLTGMRNASGLQKGFPSGFGMPPWGSGRCHGGGLEFTLPSHKTIFEVDIDTFEEKPWRYQGVDLTDFFNFGLNEESWKDYCKQLEQHRMETTMQSKIHVYESGRTGQGFDPDLPPELAAATGVRDDSTENAINGKLNAGQNDLSAPVRMRQALPTGRPIQVETGFGERLPSIDTRPPRIRDSDAIIEIVCQESAYDNSSASRVPECPHNEPIGEDLGRQRIAEDSIVDKDLGNTIHTSEALTSLERDAPRRSPTRGDIQNETSEREEDSSLGHGGSLHQHQAPRKHIKDANDSIVERPVQEDSLQMSPSHSGENNESLEGHAEQSNDTVDDYGGSGMEIPMERNHTLKGKPSASERSSVLETEQIASDSPETLEKRKSGWESPNSKAVQELEGVEDARPARSSENSKPRSSSRETYKWRDGTDEEVLQASISTQRVPRGIPDGREMDSRRSDLDRRQEREGTHLSVKARMDPHRDWDSGSVHSLPIERQKERDYSDGAWRQRENEFSERSRFEDSRKRDRGDEFWSKDRSRGHENERGDKEHLPSKRQLDNGIYKVNYEKESAMKRERDESLGSRYENMDDNHSKRKRAGNFVGRESDKEEILRQSRENSSRHERERDISINQRQRGERNRSRKGMEENHSSRLKDGTSLPRAKNDLSKDREEQRKDRQNHDGHFTKREREYDRAGLRAERLVEEKPWTSLERTRDNHKAPEEYHHRDARRQSEHARKRERVEEKPPHRQFSTEDRRSRQEKPSSRDLVSDSSVIHNRKHREDYRKNKDSERGDHLSSRKSPDDRTDKTNNMGMTGPAVQQSKDPAVSEQILSSRENREEDVTYEDEQSDSRRGRSKLERWTSHNENIKPSSSSRFKHAKRNMKSASSEAVKLLGPAKTHDTADKVLLLAERKDAGDAEKKDVEVQPLDNKHLDATEKLKKRSERFKLPMASEKEVQTIKMVENEPLPSSKTETPADSEVKPERQARKRRWVSN